MKKDGKKTPDLETFLKLVEGEDWHNSVSFLDPSAKEWKEPLSKSLFLGADSGSDVRNFRLKIEGVEQGVSKLVTLEVTPISRVFWPTWVIQT